MTITYIVPMALDVKVFKEYVSLTISGSYYDFCAKILGENEFEFDRFAHCIKLIRFTDESDLVSFLLKYG